MVRVRKSSFEWRKYLQHSFTSIGGDLSISGITRIDISVACSSLLLDLSLLSNLSTSVRVLPGTTATAKMGILQNQLPPILES